MAHLTLIEDQGLCGGRGDSGKGFLAASNLKHLWLSGVVKRMWLKQIKITAGSKYTHKSVPSGSSFPPRPLPGPSFPLPRYQRFFRGKAPAIPVSRERRRFISD